MADDSGKALRESEARFQTLFAQAPLGIFIFDTERRLTESNACLARLLGCDPKAANVLALLETSTDKLLPAMASTLSGEPTMLEGWYERLAGRRMLLALRLSPLRDAGGVVIGGMGMVEDISERIDADSRLRASEQRMALHVQRNPLGVITWNQEFKVVEWNPSAARIFGFSAEEAMGRHASFILPDQSRAQVDAVFADLITRRGGERSTNANVTKDGRTILCEWYNTPLLDEDGNVCGATCLVEDVTERETAKRALEKSEARFRTLIEHAPDAICVVRKGQFVYVNPALVSYLGYRDASELEGHPARNRLHVDDRAGLTERAAARESGAVLEPREYRLVRADGETVTAEVVSMLIDFDGGPAVLALARDLTQRKRMEAHLLQSDRMASVGTLAAGVAHEINNPLAYVKANLDVVTTRSLPQLAARLRALEEELAVPSSDLSDRLTQIAAMLELAREGSERVRFIVRDLKIFSRAADDTSAPVDVARVLDAAVNMAWAEIRNRAKVIKDYSEIPPVDANESRLGQVFLNLLANAAQAIPEGRSMENEIRIRTYVDVFDRVCVAVSDTGGGIPAEVLARIFDPFFTTKAVGVGTGLGLWICQGIVAKMGGEIRVASTKGRGTTIIVSLPSRFASKPEKMEKTANSEARGRP